MVGISGAVAWFTLDKAAGTDWGCAFSEESAECLQPDKKAPKECVRDKVDHGEWFIN